MKRGMVWVVLLLIASASSAQTFAEWFNQKKTQIRYLTEQIAALRAYGAVVNKGYGIAKGGLDDISKSKGDDYRQHDGYFLSLLTVKSFVKNHPKIRAIHTMHSEIAKINHVSIREGLLLTNEERTYVKKVIESVAGRSDDLVQQLHQIATDGTFEMKDDERLLYVEKIYSAMLECKTFAQAFADRTKLLIAARRTEMLNIEKMKRSYQIK